MVTVNALPSNDMRLHGTFCKSSVLSVLLLARIIVLEAPSLPGNRDKLRIFTRSTVTQKSQLIKGVFRLIFTLGCLHYTPPSAASPYSGRWPSTVDSTHVAKLSRRGWSFNYEHFNFQQLLNCTASTSTFNNYSSILPILQLSTITLTCTANTGCPCSHGKDRESHQFQQNLSRPRLA